MLSPLFTRHQAAQWEAEHPQAALHEAEQQRKAQAAERQYWRDFYLVVALMAAGLFLFTCLAAYQLRHPELPVVPTPAAYERPASPNLYEADTTDL